MPGVRFPVSEFYLVENFIFVKTTNTTRLRLASIAQLAEHALSKRKVTSSILVGGFRKREWSSPVMTPASHAGNHEFESRLAYLFIF